MSTAQRPATDPYIEARNAARRMLAAGDVARALELLEALVDRDQSGEAYALLGDAYFLAARYDRADTAWESAIAHLPADPSLAAKAERAATNVLTGMAGDEPQMRIFRERFTREWLLGGPHPGSGAGNLPAEPDAALITRLAELPGEAAGAVLSAVGKAVFSSLVSAAGTAGVTDGVWTNWHETGDGMPDSLKRAMQLLKLAFMRNSLFANNLVRPYPDGSKTAFWETEDGPPEFARWCRTADGSWNDLHRDPDGRYDPMVGAAWTRFYRNVGDDIGLESTRPKPNPGTNPVNVRALSRAMLAPRGGRTEVPFLNLWAAAWIQFMIHDWVSHGSPDRGAVDRIPLPPDDPMRSYSVETLDIPASVFDLSRSDADAGRPPTFVNEVTHWWDGSQLYGSDEPTQRSLRSGAMGKLLLTDDGTLPIDSGTGMERTGFVRNWWVGLGMLHTLFAREHNAICERLQGAYPDWDDERLFQTARLVNSALMAKIHTVEWTPGILANRTLYHGMRANWYGLLTGWFGGERPSTLEPIPIESPELGGIVGGPSVDFAKYGLSEEFTAVYRMHSLLPDAILVRRKDGADVQIPLLRTRNAAVKGLMREHGAATIAAAMGRQNCCALVANNYPAALLDISTPDMPLIDLGALDLYRDRERGIPPYNQLRAELGLPRIPDFDTLTGEPSV
ncbi:MAG TPA: peroxidase family protein, partial [Gemmatimonadaceae bacterium]|nr:peroxidase family protein [Gemmatimonadaceae bacterium]